MIDVYLTLNDIIFIHGKSQFWTLFNNEKKKNRIKKLILVNWLMPKTESGLFIDYYP